MSTQAEIMPQTKNSEGTNQKETQMIKSTATESKIPSKNFSTTSGQTPAHCNVFYRKFFHPFSQSLP